VASGDDRRSSFDDGDRERFDTHSSSLDGYEARSVQWGGLSALLEGLPPVVSARTRGLVLGSMPGALSLEQRRYYAQPRNRFWQVLEVILRQPVSSDYEERLAALDRRGIGLWDVLAECERVGSLDHRIRREVANDFETFLGEYPGIVVLAFNGRKAANSFDRLVRREQTRIDWTRFHMLALPSTSPANAAASLDVLSEEWKILSDHLL
jgi:double-stranded uracil-DNA glycosylase